MEHRTFFLGWQAHGSRAWFPIGRLDAARGGESYKFGYTRGAVEAQAALIDECAVGAETDFTEGPQQPVDFVAGEDFGQRFVALDFDFLPDVPVDA